MKTPTTRTSRISRKKDPTDLNKAHKATYVDAETHAELKSSTNGDYEPTFVFAEYQDMRTLKKMPVNNVWLDALAKELTKWADTHDDAIRFSQFLRKKSMLLVEFHRLAEKSTSLAKAYVYAIDKLGENREVGGSKFKLNWNVLSLTQGHYCPINRAESITRAKLREQSSNDSGPKFIVLESVEELAKQLIKKKEDE